MTGKGVLAVAITAILGLAAVGGVSMAMSGRPGSGVRPEGDRYRCFNPSFVSSFQTVNDSKLIIISDENQAYELGLAGPCFGIDASFAIGIRSRSGMNEVCDPFDADIVFRDNGLERHQECRIMSVRHLMGDEAAAYLGSRGGSRTSGRDDSGGSRPDRGGSYRSASSSDNR
ncbi:MAG: DUF6491 family protein [Asticcacaulis sp.]